MRSPTMNSHERLVHAPTTPGMLSKALNYSAQTFQNLFGAKKSYLPVLAVCAYTLFKFSTVGATLSLALEIPLVYNGFKKGCEAINELHPALFTGAVALSYAAFQYSYYGASINLALKTILIYDLIRDLDFASSSGNSWTAWHLGVQNPTYRKCLHLALACASAIGLYAFNTGAFNVNVESLSNAAGQVKELFTSAVAIGANAIGI